MKRIISNISLLLCSICATAQGLTGSWTGELEAGPVKLPLVFHIETSAVTMDSPNQNAKGIPCEVNLLEADTISLSINQLGINYHAKKRGDVLVGTFSQMGQLFPLTLKRGEIEYDRPQTPQPKFPYDFKYVQIPAKGDVVLSGTLTYPINYKGTDRVPVVVMVTGSGQQDRDETLMGHKPFLVIADYLAMHGIASLRYDDRGAGQSTGEAKSSTMNDNADDALAAVKWLQTNGKWSSVGVIGHSEGGTIAYMLGAKKDIDFAIALAGTALRGDSIIAKQTYVSALRFNPSMTYEQSTALLPAMRQQGGAWLRHFVDYDPAGVIAKLQIPVLSLYGEKDMQVDPQSNKQRFDELTKSNPRATSKLYPDLNHLFQHCSTGFPEEYATISETFSSEVMADIVEWILHATNTK